MLPENGLGRCGTAADGRREGARAGPIQHCLQQEGLSAMQEEGLSALQEGGLSALREQGLCRAAEGGPVCTARAGPLQDCLPEEGLPALREEGPCRAAGGGPLQHCKKMATKALCVRGSAALSNRGSAAM